MRNLEDTPMKTCPECNSNNVFRYKKAIDSQGGYGPELLPKLAQGIFSSAKILPVVCADCGYVRFYAAQQARFYCAMRRRWAFDSTCGATGGGIC